MPANRRRRSAEERIADLQKEIERIKTRAAEAKVKKDPALRHISGALRALDKALAATKDAATRNALNEARATLVACLGLHGAAPPAGGRGTLSPRARRGPAPSADRVLAYLKKHPRTRSEELAGELGTDTASLRPVLRELRDAGKVRAEGKARATRYSAVGK